LQRGSGKNGTGVGSEGSVSCNGNSNNNQLKAKAMPVASSCEQCYNDTLQGIFFSTTNNR